MFDRQGRWPAWDAGWGGFLSSVWRDGLSPGAVAAVGVGLFVVAVALHQCTSSSLQRSAETDPRQRSSRASHPRRHFEGLGRGDRGHSPSSFAEDDVPGEGRVIPPPVVIAEEVRRARIGQGAVAQTSSADEAPGEIPEDLPQGTASDQQSSEVAENPGTTIPGAPSGNPRATGLSEAEPVTEPTGFDGWIAFVGDSGDPILSLFNGENQLPSNAVVDQGVTVGPEGAEFASDSELAIAVGGAMSGEAGGISFWVKPNEDAEVGVSTSLVQLRSRYKYADRLQIWQDGPSVHLVFADHTGIEANIAYDVKAWPADDWRHVAVTWGDGFDTLYIDGAVVGQNHYDGGFVLQPESLLHIGSNYKEDSLSFDGVISGFRLYDRVLSPADVQGLRDSSPR